MRTFVRILLVAVVLNLADWPYVDEIFGQTGPVSELLGAKKQVPAPRPGAATHAQQGYQLLLGLQAVPAAPRRLQAVANERILPVEYRLPRYLIAPRIERPPIGRLSA